VEVLNVVATVAAAVAALAALGALYVAWRTLKEGRDTIAELRKFSVAAQAETEATGETVRALQLMLAPVRETTRALQVILAETRLARELDGLRSIAGQVTLVIGAMRLVKKTDNYWHELDDAKNLLAAQLAAAPAALPACAHLASPLADPRTADQAHDKATQEIKAEIEKAKGQLTAAASG
jgi:hypothetical protein